MINFLDKLGGTGFGYFLIWFGVGFCITWFGLKLVLSYYSIHYDKK